MFVHTIQIQFRPSCGYPKTIGVLLTLNAAIFTYMFSSFYVHAYLKPDKKKAVLRKEENNNVTDIKETLKPMPVEEPTQNGKLDSKKDS